MILSQAYENKILDLVRGFGVEPIEKFYIGLLLLDGTEVVGDSYARIEYDASSIAWFSTQSTVDEPSTGDTGSISNVANISWGTALEQWGTVNKIRFYLDATSEDYFCDHEITETLIENHSEVTIMAGDFIITTRNA